MKAVLQLEGSKFSLRHGPVTLVPASVDDVPLMAALCSDPQALAMLEHWCPVRGSAAQRQDALESELFGPWSSKIITFLVLAHMGKETLQQRRGAGRPVGVRFIANWLHEPSTMTCGGWIGVRYRRAGLGSAALRSALAYAYSHDNVDRVVTGTRVDNLPAQANLEACGFKPATVEKRGNVHLRQYRHERISSPYPELVLSVKF